MIKYNGNDVGVSMTIDQTTDFSQVTAQPEFVTEGKTFYDETGTLRAGKRPKTEAHVFIRYSEHPDGSDFTEEWQVNQNYIGIATGQSAPTDKSGYEWGTFMPSVEQLGEINPLYIRKAGTYKIHAIRDNTGVSVFQIYVLSEGETTTQGEDEKIHEFTWTDDELESDFSFVLDTDIEHGLYIKTSNIESFKVFTTAGFAIEALKNELNETKLDKITNTKGFLQLYGVNAGNKQVAFTIASSALALGGGRIPYYVSTGRNEVNTEGKKITIPVGNPEGAYDAANKKYVDEQNDSILLEYERDIPYHAKDDPEWQDPPTVVALDRTNGEGVYDIISIVISGYVNHTDGRACYFNQDITRQVQGVADGTVGSFKMAGILSSNGNDSLTMYDFKVDIKAEGNVFKMKTSRVIMGDTFAGSGRSSSTGNLTNVKVRSILARKINVI